MHARAHAHTHRHTPPIHEPSSIHSIHKHPQPQGATFLRTPDVTRATRAFQRTVQSAPGLRWPRPQGPHASATPRTAGRRAPDTECDTGLGRYCLSHGSRKISLGRTAAATLALLQHTFLTRCVLVFNKGSLSTRTVVRELACTPTGMTHGSALGACVLLVGRPLDDAVWGESSSIGVR